VSPANAGGGAFGCVTTTSAPGFGHRGSDDLWDQGLNRIIVAECSEQLYPRTQLAVLPSLNPSECRDADTSHIGKNRLGQTALLAQARPSATQLSNHFVIGH